MRNPDVSPFPYSFLPFLVPGLDGRRQQGASPGKHRDRVGGCDVRQSVARAGAGRRSAPTCSDEPSGATVSPCRRAGNHPPRQPDPAWL